MEILFRVFSFFMHLDTHLASLISAYGSFVYTILFAIIFMETGLVVTPFLPGDSLLFAAGAIAASTGEINVWLLLILLSLGAILGNISNYHIGRHLGLRALQNGNSKLFKREYIDRTEEFYAKHGNKAVILGRFFPIIRTFVPFIAGIGRMEQSQFYNYTVIGGISWAGAFILGGYFFGNIQFVREHFSIVILGIIFVSLLPAAWQIVQSRRNKKTSADEQPKSL